MLSRRVASRLSRWIHQIRCSSTVLDDGERKLRAFSVIDPYRIQLKPPVQLRGQRFLAGADSETFPEYLSSANEQFPLALEATGSYSIKDWGKFCKEEVDANLIKYGAVLFRGLPLESAEDFQSLFRSMDYKPMEYVGGSAYREQVVSQVYSASEEPPECCIDLHNEMSYTPVVVKKFIFFCLYPSEKNGIAVACKNADLFAQLDQKYIDKIIQKKIRYIRFCPDDASSDYLSWQTVLRAATKEEAEKKLSNLGVDWEWEANNDLTYWNIFEPMRKHYDTGKDMWFNQVHSMHASFFKAHPSFYEKNLPDHRYPFHTTYGDGEELEAEFVQQIRDAGWRSAIGIPWEKGDVLLLDNMQVQHGRLAFEGERKILVALCD